MVTSKNYTSSRYLSLDVLRGLTIALMIVVNTPGSWSTIYAPLEHAQWHGFTPTDWVFPTFLFAVGNAMSFSLKKFEGKPDHVFLNKILKRTALIFLLGILLHLFPFVKRLEDGGWALKDLSRIRVFGVLPRIALCYGFAALVIRYVKPKVVFIFSAVLLLVYWGILYWAGTHPDAYSLENNAVLKLDLLILSPGHLYQGFGIPFDPEGLLSTFPAVVSVISGYLTGKFIQKNGNTISTVLALILWGGGCIVIALLWNRVFPINKALWTSSYVLYAAGWDLIIIPVLLWTIEIRNIKVWTYFFEVFGKNPLFIFMLSGGLIKLMTIIRINDKSLNKWLYDHLFLSWAEGKNASLFFALTYMLLLWFIGYVMDRKKIYIKV